MHPAYSVIFFTISSGAGYGLLMLLGLVGWAHGPASSLDFGLTAIIVALGLISAGLLSSTAHLGHPERAWRAFSQWHSSWLSREGVAAMVTYLPALVFAGLWLSPNANQLLLNVAGIALIVMAFVTVFCTAMIYASLPTIRHWHHVLVVPIYLMFAIASGAVLLTAIAQIFGRGQLVLFTITLLSLLVVLALKISYWLAIDREVSDSTVETATGLGALGKVQQWEVPHTAENFVMQEMGYRIGRKHGQKLRSVVIFAIMIAAAAMLVAFAQAGQYISLTACFTAVLAMAVAVVAERWLFFAEARHVASLYYGADKV